MFPHVAVLLVDGKPLCRIATRGALSGTVDVISTVFVDDVSAFGARESFRIEGFTKSDARALREYTRALYDTSHCAFATCGSGFIYIFPACVHFPGSSGADAVGVAL